MKNITFGKLLEKLLYLSNQKKSVLAKVLGYDISYISKWINEKNLPTQKSISDICRTTAGFIVDSLNTSNMSAVLSDGPSSKVRYTLCTSVSPARFSASDTPDAGGIAGS